MMNIKAKRYLHAFFSITIGFSIFFFLAREIDLSRVVPMLRSVNWYFFALAFSTYGGVNIVRMERFHVVLDGKISRVRLLYIIFVQNFLNTFSPFRLGEASYIFMVRKSGDVAIGSNIASLMSARALDLLSVLSIFMTSLFFLFEVVGRDSYVLFGAALLLFILSSLSFALLIFQGEKIAAFFNRLLKATRLSRFSILRFFFVEKLSEVVEGFKIFHHRKMLLKITVFSLIIWIMTFLSGVLLLKSIGVSLTLGQAVFAYAFPVFISMTPFFVLGGFGSYEGSILFPLIIFGMGTREAITVGLILHVQELAFVAVPAFVGYIGYYFFLKRDDVS